MCRSMSSDKSVFLSITAGDGRGLRISGMAHKYTVIHVRDVSSLMTFQPLRGTESMIMHKKPTIESPEISKTNINIQDYKCSLGVDNMRNK